MQDLIYLDYGDILYDKPNNENFQNKLEKVQYRACLTVTSAIQGTSRTKLYHELGLHQSVATTNPFRQLLPKEDFPAQEFQKWKIFPNRKINDLYQKAIKSKQSS